MGTSFSLQALPLFLNTIDARGSRCCMLLIARTLSITIESARSRDSKFESRCSLRFFFGRAPSNTSSCCTSYNPLHHHGQLHSQSHRSLLECSSSRDSLRISPAFAYTPMILIGMGFWSVAHGMSVSQARTKYMELAKKDGEKDVEERYGFPNLYAQGTSKHVRECLQLRPTFASAHFRDASDRPRRCLDGSVTVSVVGDGFCTPSVVSVSPTVTRQPRVTHRSATRAPSPFSCGTGSSRMSSWVSCRELRLRRTRSSSCRGWRSLCEVELHVRCLSMIYLFVYYLSSMISRG